jgi:hypothetical protein
VWTTVDTTEVLLARVNAKQAHQCLAPMQAAIVRTLRYLLEDQQAKVLIYDASVPVSPFLWKNIKEVLKECHDIDVVPFNGTVQSLNKKRKRFMDGTQTVLFIPDNHVDGTNFPFVTHVVVVGTVTSGNQVNYDQFVGRATRYGRSSSLNIIHIESK